MKKKLRILFCFGSAVLGAIVLWPALLKKGPPYGFILPILPILTLAIGVMELRRYRRLIIGKPTREDIEEEIREATQSKYQSFFPLLSATTGMIGEAWPRAKRNWPAKKVELRRNMARPWNIQERTISATVIGGQALYVVGFWWLNNPTLLSRSGETLVVVVTVLLLNLMVLMFWVAGDDDDGGGRPQSPKPGPSTGHYKLRSSVVNRHRTLSSR